MTILLALVLGTFASEDLTCIAAGVLVGRGEIGLSVAISGCVAGIFIGDVGLWAIGRLFGRAALGWRWIAERVTGPGARRFGHWLQRHAAGVIVGSRFMPGTRVPLYVAAGITRLPAATFAWWAAVAAVLWVPTIVLLSASLGDVFTTRFATLLGGGWPTRLASAAVALAVLRGSRTVAATRDWRRVRARLARWSRWEFWPTWLFYAPVAVWVGALAIRHRGLSVITAANPGMADGGTVGESKFDILISLPTDCTVPSFLIPADGCGAGLLPGGKTAADRLPRLEEHVNRAAWSFPLVIKPDVGQRGVGVKLANDWDDVRAYLTRERGALIVQPFHPGPFEAGVFYYRMPGAACGRILSITDKIFPVLTGDGQSTLEELIWTHPRYRMQARTFLMRHAHRRDRVLAPGERFQLAIAGNHAQGTLFRDGRHLITPALGRRIDEIARAVPGFFIGRFDIRYGDVEAFKEGKDLAIVELNGATAESTSIYDPNTSLFDAYRQLFRQWSLVFAIGAANRAAGASVTPLSRLASLVRTHLTTRVAFELSD